MKKGTDDVGRIYVIDPLGKQSITGANMNRISKIRKYRTIQLPCGRKTVVDTLDYIRVKNYNWYALKSGKTTYVYGYPRGRRAPLVLLHRLILDVPPGMEVDHRDRDGLNNRRSNLRLATRSQNNANRGKQRRKGGTTSRFKGVFWYPRTGKWLTQIRVDRKQYYIGYFTDEIEAARAFDRANLKMRGEFAVLNFPDELKRPKQLTKKAGPKPLTLAA